MRDLKEIMVEPEVKKEKAVRKKQKNKRRRRGQALHEVQDID